MPRHFIGGGYPNPDPYYISPEEEAEMESKPLPASSGDAVERVAKAILHESRKPSVGISNPHALAQAALTASGHEGLVEALREMTLLFKSALLCTTPEIAEDGMVYVRKAEAILSRAS